jgi:hypothetical protein
MALNDVDPAGIEGIPRTDPAGEVKALHRYGTNERTRRLATAAILFMVIPGLD